MYRGTPTILCKIHELIIRERLSRNYIEHGYLETSK